MISVSKRDVIPGAPQRFNLVESLRSVFRAFTVALSLLQDFTIAVPMIIYFALKLAVIFTYTSSSFKPWSSLWAIFVEGFSGGDFSRYPLHLLLMQTILGRIDMISYILVHVVFLSATIIMMSSALRGKRCSMHEGFASALNKYFHLVVAALLASVAMLVFVNIPGIITGYMGGLSRLWTFASVSFLGLIAQALFLYAMPIILLEGISGIRAAWKSFRLAWNIAARTFLLVALPFILTLPTTFLGLRAEALAGRLSPEFMAHIHIANEVIQLIATYLIIGGATVIYIWRKDTIAR